MASNITFQQIETFLVVAERLSLSDAASAMYISQPALSKTISRLEDAIGTKLFIRSNRGVSLTREGEYLYSEIKRPYAKMESVIRTTREMSEKPAKILRIGYPSSYDYNSSFDVIRKCVQTFRDTYPDIEIEEFLYEFAELRSALVFGDLDIMIGQSVVKHRLDNVSFKDIAHFTNYIAMSSIHPLASRDHFPLSDLKDETFCEVFCFDANEEDRNGIRNALGFTPKISYVPNFQTLIRTISQGKVVSLCGKFSGFSSEYELKFFSFPENPALTNSRIVAAWRSDDLSPAAKLFLEMLPAL